MILKPTLGTQATLTHLWSITAHKLAPTKVDIAEVSKLILVFNIGLNVLLKFLVYLLRK